MDFQQKNKDKAAVGVEVIKGAHPHISENIFVWK
jgi:hypothetical protein